MDETKLLSIISGLDTAVNDATRALSDEEYLYVLESLAENLVCAANAKNEELEGS